MTIWLFSKIRPWYYSDQTSYTRSPFTSFEFPAKNSPIITFNIWISRQKLINQSKGSLDFSLQNKLNFGIIKDPSSHFFEFLRQNLNGLQPVQFWRENSNLKVFTGSRSPVRSPPTSFYPPLHSMWSFSTHGVSSGSSGLNGMASNSASAASKDYGYPPTPPIDLKSSSDNQQHLQLQQHQHQHQDYLHQDLSEAAAGLQLPSLASIDTKNHDNLMSMFPSYSTSNSSSARKFHEGKLPLKCVARLLIAKIT